MNKKIIRNRRKMINIDEIRQETRKAKLKNILTAKNNLREKLFSSKYDIIKEIKECIDYNSEQGQNFCTYIIKNKQIPQCGRAEILLKRFFNKYFQTRGFKIQIKKLSMSSSMVCCIEW